jgi:hypothetical protein
MSATKPMRTLRRRPMPGMPAASPAVPVPPPSVEPDRPDALTPTPAPERSSRRRVTSATTPSGADADASPRRHPVEDYATTHLTNFRIPVDLHVRYGRLLALAQEQHPRLRKMSLTEVVIALLAEGPQTSDEVAELVRRKRTDEHSAGVPR